MLTSLRVEGLLYYGCIELDEDEASNFEQDLMVVCKETKLLEKQVKQLQAENKEYVAVINRCIKAMKGSNCLELKWLEKALEGD